MVIECPNRRALPSQGTNYAKLLTHAEAGKLVCSCARCDYAWTPSVAAHQIIATNLRRLAA